MNDWDIHNEVHLVPWQASWPRAFHMEKQRIIASLIASDHNAYIFSMWALPLFVE